MGQGTWDTGQGKWEGEAPAEPIERNMGQGTWDTGKNLGSPGGSPPRFTNAEQIWRSKIRRQPLAEASGM